MRQANREVRGAVAQLEERLNGIQEVDGSIPFSSTNKIKDLDTSLEAAFILSYQ